MVPTDTAIYSALPWHGRHNVDPNTRLDTNIAALDQGQLSKLENRVVEDQYGTNTVPLDWLVPW